MTSKAAATSEPDDEESAIRGRIATGAFRDAAAALVELHGDRVYGHCRWRLRSCPPDVAADVAQRVFQDAYRDLTRFEGRGRILSWLIGIAENRCRDAHRKFTRDTFRFGTSTEDAVVELVDRAPDAGEQIDRHRTVTALEDCLERLQEDSRVAVHLHHRMGMSFEEMSDALHVQAKTLQARVARALPRLRRCLERKGISL